MNNQAALDAPRFSIDSSYTNSTDENLLSEVFLEDGISEADEHGTRY